MMRERDGLLRYAKLEVAFRYWLRGSALGPIGRRLPMRLRRAVQSVIVIPTFAALASDRRSVRSLIRLYLYSGGDWGDQGNSVRVRLRPLGGESVLIRPRTSDIAVLQNIFVDQPHVPPQNLLDEAPALIVDLGANIGLSMAHLAVLFPSARILGVELDHENAALCRANVRPWKDRCELFEGGVWPVDGEVGYRASESDELVATSAFKIDDGSSQDSPALRRLRARAVSLNSLLATVGEVPIDYMKMDIEGAEEPVLQQNTEWAARVKFISVEVHRPYSVDRCMAQLTALGFDATRDPDRDDVVYGVRDIPRRGGDGSSRPDGAGARGSSW